MEALHAHRSTEEWQSKRKRNGDPLRCSNEGGTNDNNISDPRPADRDLPSDAPGERGTASHSIEGGQQERELKKLKKSRNAMQTHQTTGTSSSCSPGHKVIYRKGDVVAVATDSEDPFWLGLLAEDSIEGVEEVAVRWIEPEGTSWELFALEPLPQPSPSSSSSSSLKRNRRKRHDRSSPSAPGRSGKSGKQLNKSREKEKEEEIDLDALSKVPNESIICKVKMRQLTAERFRLERSEKSLIMKRKAEEFHPGLEWISSHLQPNKIIWSSHPHILAPDVALEFGLEEQRSLEEDPSHLQIQPDNFEKEFAQAARLLEETPAILIMAGAGMGVDSGLPDYRGRQGFWRDYPPLKRLGITFDDSHDPSWFIKDRQQSWGFYGHRAKLYSEKRPHEGYDFLLRVARSKNNNFFIFTSNIDEHFQKAGFEKQRIYECHGSLSYAQCTTPCWNEGRGGSQVWPVTVDQLPQVDEETLRVPTSDMSVYPKCPYCNELARPNVSLAGDTQDTWVPARSHGQKKRLLRWLKSVLYESKDGDAWQQRTEEEQGESDEYSEDEGESEEEEEWDSAVQQKESLCKDTQRLPPKLVVIELGCGDSIHSIRIEADVLIAENPSVRLIRINPNFRGALRDGHVAIRLGALAALQGIGRHLNKNSCPTELRRRSYESLANPIHS